MGAITPDPGRAEHKVDDERRGHPDHVRQQVEDAGQGEQLEDADIDGECRERHRVEGTEAARGQPAPTTRSERPDLVEHVVVHDREFDRDRRCGQERHRRNTVQQQQREVVDAHAARADDHEAHAAPTRRRRVRWRLCRRYRSVLRDDPGTAGQQATDTVLS
jgi:hypothetical protein